jgi:hypothetical protein
MLGLNWFCSTTVQANMASIAKERCAVPVIVHPDGKFYVSRKVSQLGGELMRPV